MEETAERRQLVLLPDYRSQPSCFNSSDKSIYVDYFLKKQLQYIWHKTIIFILLVHVKKKFKVVHLGSSTVFRSD